MRGENRGGAAVRRVDGEVANTNGREFLLVGCIEEYWGFESRIGREVGFVRGNTSRSTRVVKLNTPALVANSGSDDRRRNLPLLVQPITLVNESDVV